jgi:hypothetical protein
MGRFLKSQNMSFKFYAIGKKATWYAFKNRFTHQFETITFLRKRISQQETLKIYSQSNVIIDIVRKNQTGLSFRIFEAMGLEKKVITNNANIVNYPFYDSYNFLLIKDEKDIFALSFFHEECIVSKSIYQDYTIKNWILKIFKI